MFYIILAAVVVFALFVILRDSSDGAGYNRKGESPRSAAILPSEQEKPVKATAAAANAEKQLSWTYLYYLDYDKSVGMETLKTEVTGMRYYCSLADVGPVNGTVRLEPENAHDSRAQVVIRADGKKLGYIPHRFLDQYEAFNGKNLICPFVGQISVDRQGYMKADILVALPESREFVKDVLS